MKSKSILLLSAVLLLVGCAKPLSKSQNEALSGKPGFQLASSASCASTGVSPSGRIFRMSVPIQGQDITVAEAQNFLNQILTTTEADRFIQRVRTINKWNFEQCIAGNRPCYVVSEVEESTAFLVEDGSLLTSLHTLEGTLEQRIDYANQVGLTDGETWVLVEGLPLDLFLFNSANQPIALPNQLQAHVEIQDILQIQALRSQSQILAFSDFARIHIAMNLGFGFSLATSRINPGERITLFGFPGKTSDRSQFGRNESDGESMYCSIGSSIDVAEGAFRNGTDFFSLSSQLQNLIRLKTFSSDGDTMRGFSGGPMFNSAGQVIGVLSSGTDATAYPASFGAYLPNLAY